MRVVPLPTRHRHGVARCARTLALLAPAVLFAACGGGGAGSTGGTAPPPPTQGSATLSWTVPTTRTDGTPLTEIAGFRIYYGTSMEGYPNMVPVANGLTTYMVTNLTSGTTYHFAATVLDASGVESDLSNPVSATIP